MMNENTVETESCANCKAGMPQNESCESISLRKEFLKRLWESVPSIIEVALIMLVLSLAYKYNHQLGWIKYAILPVSFIVMTIIAYFVYKARVGETLTDFLKSNKKYYLSRITSLFFATIVIGFLEPNYPDYQHIYIARGLFAILFFVWFASNFLDLLSWKNQSKGRNCFNVIKTIVCALLLLSLTHFPNICIRPINTLTNLTIGRPVLTEIHYNQRGFLGVYRTTGTATIYFRNGDTFVGDVVGVISHGHGELTWYDGTTFIGDFYDGMRHGQGKQTWPDGWIYDGEFFNGRRHGQGELTWPDDRMYIGDFNNGRRHGRGILWNSDRTKKYVGEWIEGRRTGTGTLYDAQGNEIESEIWEKWSFLGR